MEHERLITREDAAQMLGKISLREVDRFFARGTFKRIKMGRSTKLIFSQVLDYIEKLKQSA